MPVWRLQVQIARDTAFPRDRVVMTPHFNDGGALTDPDSLCEDMADAIVAWHANTHETIVTAYDAQGTPPVYPQGSAIRNAGTVLPSSIPREIALCLSFYSGRNIPRQRGRLYVPCCVSNVFADPGVRPGAAMQEKVAALAPIFEGLGGADVDWCVYSRVDDVARPVTNWWVDNEWDTVRTRGLRGDARLTGTTAEA